MSFKNEKIVETKSCQQCQVDFDITDRDLEFYDQISPVFDSQRFQIPTPRNCPECRHRQRLSFRNERKLYKRKCDASGKDIISVYSPDKPYKVYNSEFWWSDQWNPLDYGFDFDITQSFSSQFDRLLKTTPQLGMIHINSHNSQYTSFTINSQNCYKSSGIVNSEDCLYTQF